MRLNPCRSASSRDYHRSRAIHAASAERTAPLGNVNPADESKQRPEPSRSVQRQRRAFSLAFRQPVVMFARRALPIASLDLRIRRAAAVNRIALIEPDLPASSR